MTIPVATVIGGGPWEAELVTTARTTGLARVVARCVDPDDVTRAARRAKVVIVGSETPWLTAGVVRTWRSQGLAVVGVHPPTDRPGRRLLTDGGCDLVVADHRPALDILRGLAGLVPPPDVPLGILVSVCGPRGAPGRSEIALAIAWLLGDRAPTLLAECDLAGQSIGLRLALPPPTAAFSLEAVGPIEVLHLAPGGGPLGESVLDRTLALARGRYRHVVNDLGPRRPSGTDPFVLVTTAEPVVLVRTAALLDRWDGPPPLLVANRVHHPADIRTVRRATGLDPIGVVPDGARPTPGSPPPPPILDGLADLVDALRSDDVSGPPGSCPGSGGPSAWPEAARRPRRHPRAPADG